MQQALYSMLEIKLMSIMMVLKINQDGELGKYMLLIKRYLFFIFPPKYSFTYNDLYDVQQIQCLYRNESMNQYVLGWFYVNDSNKVQPVGTHKHEYININHDTKISQSQVPENHRI